MYREIGLLFLGGEGGKGGELTLEILEEDIGIRFEKNYMNNDYLNN